MEKSIRWGSEWTREEKGRKGVHRPDTGWAQCRVTLLTRRTPLPLCQTAKMAKLKWCTSCYRPLWFLAICSHHRRALCEIRQWRRRRSLTYTLHWSRYWGRGPRCNRTTECRCWTHSRHSCSRLPPIHHYQSPTHRLNPYRHDPATMNTQSST